MLTCADLKQYSMSCPPDYPLCRSARIQEKYDTFISNPENKKKFIEKITKMVNSSTYYFTENNFPYHTVRGIEHWVCWYKRDHDVDFIIDCLKEQYDIVTYWKNLPNNRSIQEINHLHVFIDISGLK